jgi:Tfp pilus assembly protein PilO
MILCHKPKIFDVDLYGLIAVLGLCIAAWLLLVNPLQTKIQQQTEEQQKNLQDTEQSRVVLVQKRQSVQGLEELSAHLKQAAGVLEENRGIPEVIARIGDLARNTSIRLDNVQPGSRQKDEFYQKTTLELKMYGSFPDTYAFLVQMAEQLPFVRVDSLMLNKQDDGELSRCAIDLTLDIFGHKQLD